MAKLIDRILSDTAREDSLQLRAASAHVFDICNVIEPYVKLGDANPDNPAVKMERELSEFAPNLAPPFNTFWMEYKTKSWPFTEAYASQLTRSPYVRDAAFSFPFLKDASIGACFRVGSDPDENASVLMNALQKLQAAGSDTNMIPAAAPERIDANHFFETVVPATKWVLQVYLYVEANWDKLTREPSVVGPIVASIIPIDSEGRPIKSRWREAALGQSGSKVTLPERMLDTDLCVMFMGEPVEANLPMESRAAFSHCIMEHMGVCQMALGLINCRNIHTVDVVPPPKLAKKHKKKRKTNHDLVVYKVLQIGPTSAPAAENKPTKTGDQLRMHIARGHYKTYTEDKPLFGRYTGTFWWEAQFRGNKKKGLVNKNYQVLGE